MSNPSASQMPPPSGEQPDEEFAQMVERAQAKDGEAIKLFLACYERLLMRYIWYEVGNREVAEDVYGDVREKVCRELPKTNEGLRHPLAAKKWIFTIATNLVRDYFKARDRLKTLSLQDLEQRFEDGDMTTAKDYQQLSTPGVEEVVWVREMCRRIDEARKQVPGQLGKCFDLKYIQGFTYKEIAEILCIAESTARAYANRGRKAVLQFLAQLF